MHVFRSAWYRRATSWLAWAHRWLGLVTSVLFVMWFASGMLMLFKPFPSISPVEQLAFAEPVASFSLGDEAASVLISREADTESVRVLARAGAPSLLVGDSKGLVALDIETGAALAPLNKDQVRKIFESGGTEVNLQINDPINYDQWIVSNGFDRFRPLYKVSSADKMGTQYYVSSVTGEVVQKTTRSDRAWNYFGSVLHWIYITPIRSNFVLWDNLVWTISLICLFVAVSGSILGILRTVQARSAPKPKWTYFRPAWLRYHHLIGLIAFLFVLLWAYSGWLSMDHGRLFSSGKITPEMEATYRGGTAVDAALLWAETDYEVDGVIMGVEATMVDGVPLFVVTSEHGKSLYTIDGQSFSGEKAEAIMRTALSKAYDGDDISAASLVPDTALSKLAEGMPANTVLFKNPRRRLSIYADRQTTNIVMIKDKSRSAYEWNYYAIHTLSFPGLVDRPILRNTLAIILLILGLALSVTSVVLGAKKLLKSFPNRKSVKQHETQTFSDETRLP